MWISFYGTLKIFYLKISIFKLKKIIRIHKYGTLIYDNVIKYNWKYF